MIPRASGGRGFNGAAAYYLHDKGAKTSERVRFTHSINLSSDDPRRAIAEMCWTASNAEWLKEAAGGKPGGRKLEKPVYTLALAWHPTEQPNDQQMIEAGLSALKALKMDHHQVLMVAHNDTAHPHVHLIVNRVDPANGKAHGLNKDQLILSKWAQAYERDHGKTFCVARVQNNADRQAASIEKAADRRKNAFVKNDKSQRRDRRQEFIRRALELKQQDAQRAAAAQKGRAAEDFSAAAVEPVTPQIVTPARDFSAASRIVPVLKATKPANDHAQKAEAEKAAKPEITKQFTVNADREKVEKFEREAKALRDAMKEQRAEQWSALSAAWERRQAQVEEKLNRTYGKDRAKCEARLKQLDERREKGSWLTKAIDRIKGQDAERIALQKDLKTIDAKCEKIWASHHTNREEAFIHFEEHARSSQHELDARIELGKEQGYTLSADKAPSLPDHSRDREFHTPPGQIPRAR